MLDELLDKETKKEAKKTTTTPVINNTRSFNDTTFDLKGSNESFYPVSKPAINNPSSFLIDEKPEEKIIQRPPSAGSMSFGGPKHGFNMNDDLTTTLNLGFSGKEGKDDASFPKRW